MATPNLTPPVILAWGTYTQPFMCMEAAYAGNDALITLQPIQWDQQNNLQLWQFGDDGRIYLYTPQAPAQFCVDFVNPAENGQPLLLNNVIPSDLTQTWNWTSQAPAIINGAGMGYCIDNSLGHSDAGNKIQIYQGGGSSNSSEVWLPVQNPQFNLANLGSAKAGPAHAATR